MQFLQNAAKFFMFLLLTTFLGCSAFDIFDKGKETMMGTDLSNSQKVIALFPTSADQIKQQAEKIIEETNQRLQKIIDIRVEDRTFENTVRALDKAGELFSYVKSPLEVVQYVTTSDAVREECSVTINKLNSFAIDVFSSVPLFKAFKSYVEGNAKKEDLNPEQKYFLKESMDDFIREGLNLPPEKFAEANELKKKIAKLSLEFEANIAKDKSKISVTKDALAGLKDDFINNLEKTKDGKYLLGCDYPTFFEVMPNCSVESTRKALYLTFQRRAYPQNMKVLDEIIKLRDELAKKLGFESFAAFNIDSEMAKTPNRANQFILDLIDKVEGKAKEEIQELLSDLPADVKLTKDGKLEPWDLSYIKNIYKKKHFDVDEREIAEYFPMEKTVEALFDIYQKFLNVEFKISDAKGSWHEDVKLIEVYDKDTKELRGYVFLDLYPRPNKFSHACLCDAIATIEYKDKDGKIIKQPSVGVIIANFPKSTKDKPSLLKHSDVTTFFHEFGHAMHQVLGRTEMAGFSGTNTKCDFVEVPSQMFEEWMWDKKMLKDVTSHYKTGKSLPEEIIEKKIALKKFDSGFIKHRQGVLSLASLDLFASGEKKDTDKIFKDLYEEYDFGIRFEPQGHFQASFGHLTGYGARYYSYMWSKVFALDLFDYIKEHGGLLDPKIGKKLVDEVLGKGGSVEPDELLRTFLGREPNQDAFLKDIGVKN